MAPAPLQALAPASQQVVPAPVLTLTQALLDADADEVRSVRSLELRSDVSLRSAESRARRAANMHGFNANAQGAAADRDSQRSAGGGSVAGADRDTVTSVGESDRIARRRQLRLKAVEMQHSYVADKLVRKPDPLGRKA